MSAGDFASHLSDDATFQLGNADAVTGRAAIEEAVAGFFGSIGGISHQLLESWVLPDAVICSGTVTYTRHDGSRLTVPFANVFKMHGNLIRKYVVYVDISELYR